MTEVLIETVAFPKATEERSRPRRRGDSDRPERASCRHALRERPLRVGVSTRALFDLEDEHGTFEREGVRAYETLQRSREDVPLAKGAAFRVVERLLSLNEPCERPFVEVVLLSRNSPDLSLRTFRSIDDYGLGITTGSFTGGRAIAPFVSAWNVDLLLSNDAEDVRAAAAGGAAAARFGPFPKDAPEEPAGEVRVALDGDSVVFGAESDEVFRHEGLAAFQRHERENARAPMSAGPFGSLLRKLSQLRSACEEGGVSRVRIAIVTARSAPAHARVVHTLRAWGTPADEGHFVGSGDKAPILAAYGAHVFFDDQERHVIGAAAVVPAARVPGAV